MNKLKPCPFCGSEAGIHKFHALGEVIKFVYCPNENCHFHHRTASVSDWNTRPIEDELNARIAELERDKKALRGIEENLREHIEIGTLQLSAATARIAELEAAQCWIPVSERLPEKSGWYRVGAINVYGEGYTDEIYFDANNSKLPWQSCVRDNIYCWLDGVHELPTPPEVQE